MQNIHWLLSSCGGDFFFNVNNFTSLEFHEVLSIKNLLHYDPVSLLAVIKSFFSSVGQE